MIGMMSDSRRIEPSFIFIFLFFKIFDFLTVSDDFPELPNCFNRENGEEEDGKISSLGCDWNRKSIE